MHVYKELKDREANWEREPIGKRKVGQVACCLGVTEYSYVALFFFLASVKDLQTAMVMQLVFFSFAFVADYLASKKLGSPFGNETLKTLLMFPVGFLNIPKWLFLWLSLAPNYIRVTSTAITAGACYNLWASERFKDSKFVFQTHWSYVPWVGSLIGSLGLPWVLTGLLILRCGIQFSLMCLPYPHEVCGVANLQFLTSSMKQKCWQVTECPAKYDARAFQYGRLLSAAKAFQYGRLLSSLLIKYPMLWAKTSLLAVTCDFVDGGMLFSAVMSLALAWYGFFQLMPNFFKMFKIMCDDGSDAMRQPVVDQLGCAHSIL